MTNRNQTKYLVQHGIAGYIGWKINADIWEVFCFLFFLTFLISVLVSASKVQYRSGSEAFHAASELLINVTAEMDTLPPRIKFWRTEHL